MKLHLPKLLYTAIISAFVMPVEASYTLQDIAPDDASYHMWNVGGGDPAENPSLVDNRVVHDGDLTLKSGDKLGRFDSSGNLIVYANGDGYSYNSTTSNNKFSRMLTVNGTLTIEGTAQMAIGGQYKASSWQDYYSVLRADSVVVNGTGTGTHLQATAAIIGNLTVNNGKVSLHEDQYSGNSSGSAFGSDTTSTKTVCIQDTLTINGGTLNMGRVHSKHNNTSSSHIINAFGNSNSTPLTITQTDGTFTARGYTYAVGGLSINQSGGKMDIHEILEFSGSKVNTITQSGDGSLSIGEIRGQKAVIDFIQSGSGSITLAYGAADSGSGLFAKKFTGTINISQTGSGIITLGGGNGTHGQNDGSGTDFSTTFGSKGTYNISLTGSGTLQLISGGNSKGAITAQINADSTEVGAGSSLVLRDAGTKLTTTELTITSGAMIDNNGTLTVGTGAEGTTGVLNVTSGGTLNLTLDGTNAAINVGAASTDTKTVTGWEMAEGSTLGIVLTESGLGKTTISTIDGSDKKKIVVTDALVATVEDGSDVNLANFKCEYAIGDINGSDVSQWQMESEGTSLMKDSETGDIVLGTTLIYNPWIEITDGVERDADIKDTYVNETTPENSLLTGLDISGKDVTLSGNNSYSYGTRINGVTVTLGHENALGTLGEGREITTTGKAGLTAADGVTANLPGIIQNSGELTMEGSFKTENTTAYTGEVADLYLNTNTEEGDNGFKREGDTYQIVDNGAGASLTVGSGTSVLVGTEEMDLFTDGLAGKVNYDKYYINTDTHEADAQAINDAAEGKTTAGVDVTAVMKAGQLTANESITVDTTNGTLVITGAETVVSGTVKDTTVQAEGGEIDSIILGNTSVTINGDTTISGTSGENNYTGGIIINGAQVTLKNNTALGKGAITTTGVSRLESDDHYQTDLYQEIQNTGTLTMSGAYRAIDPKEVTLGEAYYTLEGTENSVENGFKREAGGTGYQIVDNGENGKLKVEDYTRVVVNGTIYSLNDDGLVYETMPNFDTYYIQAEGKGSEVMSQDIRLAAADVDQDAVKVIMTEKTGKLTVTADSPEYPGLSDRVDLTVESTAGTVISQTGAVVKGSLANTTIEAAGGEIQAQITGGSSVKVTEDTTLSGADNTYTGGTEIDGAELTITRDNALGTGDVQIENDGSLNMNGKAIGNTIRTVRGTLKGATAFSGNLEVIDTLTLEGDTTAAELRMGNNASVEGTTLAVDAIEAQGGTASITADVTVNNDGTITLNNGSILNVTGSLTLSGVTTLKLVGDYGDGDTLATSTGELTTGTLILDYDSAYMLEQMGNSLVLTLRFKQDIADAVGQGNWGIATASRAFVNTVRGQRNNTGCLVNGRGTVWFSALGASNDMERADISVEGAAIGADMKLTKRSTMGIAFGYTDGKVSPVGLRKINQDAYYAAVYGEHVLRNRTPRTSWVLDWVMAYGSTESEQGSMSWEQDSLQLNSRLSWNRRVRDRLTVTAFGGLEYFATNSDTVDGVKTGSIQNLRAEIGVGTDYMLWGSRTSACRNLMVYGEVSYFNDLMRNNPVIRMNGVSGSSCNPGRHGLGIEAGATYRINDKWTTSANYSFNAMEDSTEHRLNIGASMSF